MNQWERFQARNRELAQEDFGFTDSVDISVPTENYTVGKGYSLSYSSQGAFDCEISMPSSTGDQNEGGTTQTADIIFHLPDTVPDDLPNGLTEYGDSGEASARVSPEDSPLTYEVITWGDERNGVIRVEAAEVDT